MPALIPPLGKSAVTITAQNQFSDPMWIQGGFGVSIAAGLVGSIVVIQRDPLYDGSILTGFKDVRRFRGAAERSFADAAGAFYRIGCKTGGFGSGSALAMLWQASTRNGAGDDPGVPDITEADSEYETVAASQTDQVLGATGGAGDLLSRLLVVPATTSPGVVQIKDGSGSAITVFTGGAASVTNLTPFSIPLNLYSLSGAWKITTGAAVSVIASGNFS